jgi:hypothetical protein
MITKALTAHELAQELLKGPDLPVMVRGFDSPRFFGECEPFSFVRSFIKEMEEHACDGGHVGVYDNYIIKGETKPEFSIEVGRTFPVVVIYPQPFSYLGKQ